MACNSGTCQSGCHRDEYSVGEDDQKKPSATENGDKSTHVSSRGGDFSGRGLCLKCKVNESIAATHPAVSGGGGGDGVRFCADCFRSNLYGKFRLAVTSNALISPSDNVLVAFSGGSSSRVALQFVHEMQQKAQKNFDASREKVLPVFQVGVAYVDETAIYPVPSDVHDRALNEMGLIVSGLAPPEKRFSIVPTESVYSPDFASAKDRLTNLIAAVHDVTGKEDLIEHLRMLCLQKAAFENGYTKILLGTCTSRIACHVLEATVKGQGFSLAADIQYVDARWKIPVVLPLRDCLSEELNMLCSLDSLKTVVEAFERPRSGINGLISSFVKLLKEENPSRESTIVRTAGKLTPFCFNTTPEADDDQNGHLASKRRQKKYNLNPNESKPQESFCVVCNSPLKESSVSGLNGFDNGETNVDIYAAACSSCQYQILPKDTSSLDSFFSMLPESVATMAKDARDNQSLLRKVLLSPIQKEASFMISMTKDFQQFVFSQNFAEKEASRN
ncbi:cytoplasmic tRNA 2-thiolation protein 2 [Phtheirospermum japonicum]|uniref:Cytoplasmic tRNA 2-thiolation protein 2 n=1 Tax=Phtheirospermum japonicum TaxID=374723 RepID=A0A830CAQ8_9LAMI|nr:cytoplasmic tRNA 2-thiolation protein 2 [Phtheirospermum japonicum]